jgi:hypothetical protein
MLPLLTKQAVVLAITGEDLDVAAPCSLAMVCTNQYCHALPLATYLGCNVGRSLCRAIYFQIFSHLARDVPTDTCCSVAVPVRNLLCHS